MLLFHNSSLNFFFHATLVRCFLKLPFSKKCRQGVKPTHSEVHKEISIGSGLRFMKKISNF